MEHTIINIFIPDSKNNQKRTGMNLKDYSHIRAYHAYRPIVVRRYYAKGIKPFNKKEMRQAASTIFGISTETVINNEPELQSSLQQCLFWIV